MTTHEEVERTYDVAAGSLLPDLAVGPVARVGPPVTEELLTTYLDTATYALARSGVSLRRRTGGGDDGWHLKVPVSDDTKLELRRALGRGRRPPVALRRTAVALARGHELVEVADLRTTRTTSRLFDAEGTTLALLCDDVVAVDRRDGGPVVPGWREVEVELVDGRAEVLDAVETALGAAGIGRAAEGSKIRRALGVDAAGDAAGATGVPGGLARRTAGAALHRYLVDQTGRLVAADVRHRVEGASVHDLRVAARRLRSALAVYRPLLDDARARHVQGELRWIGRALGGLRDLEVAREELLGGLDDDPHDLGTGPARTAVRRHLDGLTRAARTTARSALDSDRYAAALAALDDLLTDPGWTDLAGRRAGRELARLCGRPRRRWKRAVRAARESVGADREPALHHVRKSAKRLRYALEVLEPADPKVARLVEEAKAVQSALGDHLDRDHVARLVSHVGHDGPPAASFALGRLHARLEAGDAADATRHRRAVRRLWRDPRLRTRLG